MEPENQNVHKGVDIGESVPQTGLIWEAPKPSDFVAGTATGLPYEVLLEKGDWRDYEPSKEDQYRFAKFDTMACTSFSANNLLEMWLKYQLANKLLSTGHIAFLEGNGYLVNGEVNFSDKFTAIMSGTTKDGNSFIRVADSIHNNGLIPESMLPFGSDETWEAWHNPAQITPEMRALGKKFLEYFDPGYEWVFIDNEPDMDKDAALECIKYLKHTPVQVAVPVPGRHAVAMTYMRNGKDYYLFDTYPPYRRKKNWSSPIHYAFRFVLSAKAPVVQNQTMKKYKYFSDKEIFGLSADLCTMLDKARELAGVPFVLTSTLRSPEHNAEIGGVENSAHTKGLAVDISAPDSVRRFKILSGLIGAGFRRVGVYKSHIHVDIDTSKPDSVAWLG